MKHLYIKIFYSLIFTLVNISGIFSQTASITINYSGFQACGGCTVCGSDYWCTNTPGSYCGDTPPSITQTFFDPVPAGHVVTGVTINYYTGSCEGAAIYTTISGFGVPVAYDGATGCWCDDLPCMMTTSVTANYPCGMPGYIYGGTNTFVVGSSGPMCINRAELTFTYVDPDVITPTITPSGPLTFCSGGSVTLNANGGYTGYQWSTGATSQSITVTTSGTYTVSVASSTGCTTGSASVTVTVSSAITPTFTALGPYCVGASPGALPTTSNNGISGSWSPSTISTSSAGATTYTFTPNAGQCAVNATMSVTVNTNVTPTFNSYGPYCAGDTPGVLPSTSINGITGTWSPATISTASAGTTTYTFTPTAGQCATVTTIQVVVNSANTIPLFTALGPYCIGATPGTLPGTSTNGITGTWNPAAISTTSAGTTTYTFTPTAGQCATPATMQVTVNPNPSVTASASPASICLNQCTNLTAANAASYTWMPGSLSGSTVNVCPTGTTTYTVTGTTNAGCTANSTVTVTVNPNPGITASASPSVICAGQCTDLTGSGGTNYNWMPGNILGATVNVCPSSTTTYTLLGTSGAGCSNSATVTVTVNPLPLVSATASPTEICSGQSSTLTASGASTYTWMPGNLSGSPVNVTLTGTVIYTVIGTASTGCSSTANVTVIVHPIPTITSTASPDIICPGSCSNLTASGASTYVWQPNNQTGAAINVCPATNTTYTVTGTSSDGCTASNTLSITVAPIPLVVASAMPSDLCFGECADLSAQGADTYVWMPGGLTGNIVNVCPTSSTNYTVTGASIYGCTDMETIQIIVTPIPVIVATTTASNICIGGSSTIEASGALNMQWQPGGMSGGSVTVSPANTTVYTVTGNVNGCIGTGSVTVNVYPYPIITFAADPSVGCEDLLVQFTDLSNFDQVLWYWEFGDNTFSYMPNPMHYYNDPGTYDVSLTLSTIYGCSSSYTWEDMITVYKMPIAEFVSIPESASELEPTIWFFDRSLFASAWNWYFGDLYSLNNNSNDQNPFHVYSDTGTHIVTLVAISDEGCMDTARHTIYIEPNVAIYIPNAFTPNNDPKNPNFICKGEGIDWSTFEMRIYDRWGKQLLCTHDYEEGWNGEYQNFEVPEGVYTYLISFTDVRLKKHNLKGIVTLIK